MISNKVILIIGGSGSLGNALIERYLSNNIIFVYSRDECKHWKMSLRYKSDKLKFVIGCIRDYNRIENTIFSVKPNIIIVAAALKHIDRCEYAVNECYLTNFLGANNVFNCVEKNHDILNNQNNSSNLETVLFVSTDKACNPVNTYGICKALSEKACIEKSLNCSRVKFTVVRYGNVLNSRGSIIPILHEKGKSSEYKEFTLTHKNMTRFVMTLSHSVDLIENAILTAESGDIVVSPLLSMGLIDLFEIFSEKYNKPIVLTGLRSGEKMLETLMNTTESSSMVIKDGYYYIKPYYKKIYTPDVANEYSSDRNTIDKRQLSEYLTSMGLL